LFAIILLHCYPTSPEVLWDKFKPKICDNLRRKLQHIPTYQNCQFTNLWLWAISHRQDLDEV
jgi:hypothetical protein